MSDNSVITSPTIGFQLEYMLYGWSVRGSMTEHQRKGLAQTVYVTLHATLENALQRAIHFRIKTLRGCTNDRRLPEVTYELNGKPIRESSTAVARSLSLILEKIDEEGRKAIGSLIPAFDKLYDISFRASLGETWKDIDALGEVRNVFAHGRPIETIFDSWDEGEFGSIAKSIKRLRENGIMQIKEINGVNYLDALDVLYSDSAVRYFHGATKAAIEFIRAQLHYTYEQSFFGVHLPDLM